MRPRHRHWSESDSVGRGGVGNASRFSPEGSGRRHRNNDYDRTNHHHHHHQHHHRRGGYRWTEHSRRYQPSSSLPPPRQTDILVQAGRLAAEYLFATGKLTQDPVTGKWRTVDSRENSRSTVDSRASARSGSEMHARGAESSRQRYSDEYDSRGSEAFEQGRRRYGFSRFDGSKMERELGKSGSWNERSGSSSDRNVDGDDSSAGRYKQSLEKYGNAGSQNSSPREITQGGSASLLESGIEKCNSVEDGNELSFSNKKKSLPLDVSVKMEIALDDTNVSIQESGEVKNVDLITGSGTANVSTETQSSFSKGSGSVHDYMNEDANISDRGHSEVSGVNNAKEVSMDISSGTLDSATQDKFQIIGGKCALDGDNDDRESSKRQREGFPSMEMHFGVSNRRDPVTSESTYSYPSDVQKGLNITLIPISHANSSGILEEKQLFPGPFKTCDLNLLETFVHENHEFVNQAHFNSVVEMGKEAPTVNVGLSMSSNFNLSNKNGKHGVNANDIEIIDLEDEPAHEDQSLDESKRRIKDDNGLVTSAHFGYGGPLNSSVATDFNSSHINMSLPYGEEILGNDDSVHMSLGELPSGIPEAWKKPTQDYMKSF